MFTIAFSEPLTGILFLNVFFLLLLRHTGPSQSPFSSAAISFRAVIFLHSLLLLLHATLLHKQQTFSFAFISSLSASSFIAPVPSLPWTFLLEILSFEIFLQMQFLSLQSSFCSALPSFPSFPLRREIPHTRCFFTFPLTTILRVSLLGNRSTKPSKITLLAPPPFHCCLLSLAAASRSFSLPLYPSLLSTPLHTTTHITTASVLENLSDFAGTAENNTPVRVSKMFQLWGMMDNFLSVASLW